MKVAPFSDESDVIKVRDVEKKRREMLTEMEEERMENEGEKERREGISLMTA